MVNRVNAYDQQRFDPHGTVVKLSKDGTRYMDKTARFGPCTLVEHLNTNHHEPPLSDSSSRSINLLSTLFRSIELNLKNRRKSKTSNLVEQLVPQEGIEVLHNKPKETLVLKEEKGLLDDSILTKDNKKATSKKHIFSCLDSFPFREPVLSNYSREKDMNVTPPPQFRNWLPVVH